MPSDVHIGEELLENRYISLPFVDRTLGTILLGATGKGKTSLMEHLIAEDMKSQAGILNFGCPTSMIFDPHGELSERILRIGASLPLHKILFCEITGNLSYGFNPLEVQHPGDPLEESQTIDSLMQVFRKHWSDNPAYSFGSRVEWVLSNTARTILANPGYTLAEIPLLLSDKAFRDKLVRNVVNPQVQFFWGEYRQLESTRRPVDTWQMVESTITRLTQFLANEWLYRVLYQAKGTIKFHELIDSGKTIIFSLPIGKLGEEPASLLGSLLLGKLATTIFGRNEYGKQYPRVHIYIDEYARFSIPLISQLWVQARKFNCGMTATIQTLSQIKDEESRAAILQAGNLIAFQCIGSDADIIAKQMPLPDPVSLMKPEPILVYSSTPVEDIWHRGHPNERVKQIRTQFFWPVGTLEDHPQQTDFPFDAKEVLQEHPEWQQFIDWGNCRSSREMLQQGIVLLDEYYGNWMNHQYAEFGEVNPEEVTYLVKITQCLAGVMGVRPTMEPFIEEEKWRHLLTARQQQIDNMVEKLLEENRRNFYKWGSPEFLRHTLEEEGWLERLPVNEILNVFTVRELPDIRAFLYDLGLSLAEVDRLIEWRMRPYFVYEEEFLTDFIHAIVRSAGTNSSQQMADIIQDSCNHYVNVLAAYSLSLSVITPDLRQRVRGVPEADKQAMIAQANQAVDPQVKLTAVDKCREQALYLFGWIIRLRDCGVLLEKEPVFSQTHRYKDVEYNRRTYSDLREELVTKLVSLPPYQAIVHLASQSGELPIQVLTPRPLQISPDAEPKANAVREESRKKLGHPWQEVVKDIQTRQNLPPAKPQI